MIRSTTLLHISFLGCFLHTEGVTGSNPVSPPNLFPERLPYLDPILLIIAGTDKEREISFQWPSRDHTTPKQTKFGLFRPALACFVLVVAANSIQKA
jgi:hypothetical protein